MAISRFQMNRQLRAYGGIMGQDGRRNYGVGSFFQKYIKDPVERVLTGKTAEQQERESQERVDRLEAIAGKGNTQPISNFFKDLVYGKETPVNEDGTPKVPEGTTKRTGGILGTLLQPKIAIPIASGLLAGAFTKDEEDPLFTGQDVGLNLMDIRRLANVTDPKTGQAIGLSFLPDVEARKFTPTERAASFAANQPQDFTEDRTPAQGGGMMGDQKDFEEFLRDMQNRDKQMLQDRILEDFEKFMRRKRMIDKMPEAKNGGLMKMAKGGMMDMGGMEMDLRGGGFVPMGKAEKADDVPARLSKNEFVFTADAVRAAGGGNIDKGADKMYATMKALENKVA